MAPPKSAYTARRRSMKNYKATTSGTEVGKAVRKSSKRRNAAKPSGKKKSYVKHSKPYGGYTVLVHQHYRTPRS